MKKLLSILIATSFKQYVTYAQKKTIFTEIA